jgi:hypothetical protein
LKNILNKNLFEILSGGLNEVNDFFEVHEFWTSYVGLQKSILSKSLSVGRNIFSELMWS